MTPDDFMPALSMLLMLGLLAIAVRLAGGIQQARNARAALAARRLAVYMQHGRPYRIYVSLAGALPAPRSDSVGLGFSNHSNETRWQAITDADEHGVTLAGGVQVPLAAVAAFAVAYPSGRMLDAHAVVEPLPPGLFFPEPQDEEESDLVDPAALAAGRPWLSVSFQHAGFPAPLEGRWRIRLRNTGPEAVRVVSFGVYEADGDLLRLATDSGAAFSPEDFGEWYAREEGDWIQPGETVEDPNGYGSVGQVWVYYLETQGGADLLAGGEVPSEGGDVHQT